MRATDLAFLKALLDAPSPSGFEQPAAAVFRERVMRVADTVETTVMGSVHATLAGRVPGAASVMLAGHIDEIGLMVSYITPEGFLAVSAIGGVDPAILQGARVHVHTRRGAVLGVVGRKPIHLTEEEERKSVPKLDRLFVDLGRAADEVRETVRVGDPVTIAAGFERLGGTMAVARAFDDKVGAFIAARVLEEVARAGRAAGDLTVAATVQEEIGLRGGITSAWRIDADIGVAIEVGHATDYLDIDKRKHGEAECGKGPIIARGPNINPVLFELIVAAAERERIPYQIGAEPRGTGTDANVMQISRGGKATALVSVPLRYMHTQSEVLSLRDVEAAIRLLTRFVLDLEAQTDLTPTI